MRFILALIIISGIIGLFFFGGLSDGLKGAIIGGLIGFSTTYFQARTSNYFNIQKQGDEILSLFWKYQDVCSKDEEVEEDLNFKKELLDIAISKKDNEEIKQDEKSYYECSEKLSKIREKKQHIKNMIYSKVFVYLPRTAKLFKEYTNLETQYYLETKDLKDKSALGRYDKLKTKELEIQNTLLEEVKSHKSFFI